MDLNVNKLPETDDSRLKPNTAERNAPQPQRTDSLRAFKIAGFIAVVTVIAAMAMNSHQSGPSTMASDTPPVTDGATTMPSITAPTERTTTGSAPREPGMAPTAPSEPTATGTQPDN